MASSSSSINMGKILKRANPATIQDKFLVGYQGWFTCPGDGEPVGQGHHGWLHWFNYPIPDGGRPNTDLWPDVSSYSPSELFPVPGLKSKSGEPLFLFSSRNAKTVQRHFRWMAEHGVDGAFLQRFAGQCDMEGDNEGIRRIRDEVGDRVQEAAEKEGRVFAIMYDVSGVPADRIQRVIERDWIHLIHDKGVLDSPNYLKEKGKPVVSLWGFGFDNAGHSPSQVREITNYIRRVTPGGAYIIGGSPAHWRTAESDADRNPEFLDVWLNNFDAISPWTVGRYRNVNDADHFAETKMKGDVELLNRRNEEGKRKVDYIPVVLPGGSGFNLSEGKWGFNDIKRNGGRFLWQQIFNARRLGVRVMYGAMWDEYDEGTAFMPVVESKRLLPESDKWPFMALDEDGYDLPSDWYMRICGFAAEGLRSERRIHESFPSKELQDYWASRPKYENVDPKSSDFVSGASGASGSSAVGEGGGGQSYQEWLVDQKDTKDELPPPPYSLEAENEAAPDGSAPSNVAQAATSSEAQESSTPLHIPVSSTTMSSSTVQPHISGSSQQTESSYATSQSADTNASGRTEMTGSQDSVASLVNDFGRHRISSPSQATTSLATPLSGTSSHSTYAGRVQQQNTSSSASSQTVTHNVPQSGTDNLPHSSYVSPNASHSPPTHGISSNNWSQGQWPPPEWKINTPQQQQHAPYASGSSQVSAGANLSRPQTFTTSLHTSAGASLSQRPHASAGPSSSMPTTPYQVPTASTGGHTAGFATNNSPQFSIDHASDSSTAYSPSSGSNLFPTAPLPSGMPPFNPVVQAGSSFEGHLGSSYGGRAGSSYDVQDNYYPRPAWTPGFSHSSPPRSPPVAMPGAASYLSQENYPLQGSSGSYNTMPGSNYSGNTYSSDSAPPPHMPSYIGMPQYSPSHSGEGGYFNGMPQYPQSGPPQPQVASYPSQYGTDQPYRYPAHPQSPSSAWTPNISYESFPPAVPPRPLTHMPQGSSYQSGPSYPATSSAESGALGYALNAVDRVAGRKTRIQVENIANAGSKLLGKFTK